jgi:hypothetical protein
MAYFLSPFFCALLFATAVVGDNGNGCTTFSINGSTPTHFEYHRFYDFRNIQSTAKPLNSSSDLTALPLSKSVNDTSWTTDWKIQVGSRAASNNGTIAMQYSAASAYIGRSLFSLRKSPRKTSGLT